MVPVLARPQIPPDLWLMNSLDAFSTFVRSEGAQPLVQFLRPNWWQYFPRAPTAQPCDLSKKTNMEGLHARGGAFSQTTPGESAIVRAHDQYHLDPAAQSHATLIGEETTVVSCRLVRQRHAATEISARARRPWSHHIALSPRRPAASVCP